MATKIIGDLHIRKEEPFNTGATVALEQLEDDQKNFLIFLGDFFHSSKPFPGDYLLAITKLIELSRKNIVYIMAGNNAHEYHYIQKTWAIDPLEMENVVLVKRPKTFEIENKTYLMLPWVPQEVAKEYGAESIEELYSDIGKFIDLPKHIDYVLYHFEDETVFMGGVNHGIDLTYLDKLYPQIKRIGGHIHLQSENYLGTPYQTRYDEKGQIPHYLVIDKDTETYKDLELYFEFVDVNYEDEVPIVSNIKAAILTISNAPSVKAAEDKFRPHYGNIFIRKIELSTGEERTLTIDQEEKNSSVKEFLNDYLSINNVDKKTSKYLLNLF